MSCESCRTGIASYRLTPQVSAAVSAGCRRQLEQWISEEKAPAGCAEARRFLEDLIETHAERKLVTRAMMEESV